MAHLDAASLGTLLVFVAHPDDETYLAGGLIAAAVEAGSRVVCVCATAGELGTEDPVAWPPERLGPVRRWEAAAAMAVLGVRDHRWLGLADGSLAELPLAPAAARVARVVHAVAPDTVVTFGPDGATFHPDHQAVSRWVDAARRQAPAFRLLHVTATAEHLRRWGPTYEAWGIYLTEERPEPVADDALAVHLVLEGRALDQKVAALAAMATQTGPARALLGEAAYRELVAEEAFVEVPPEP